MRGRPVTFSGFTDGVNLADGPYSLKDTEARDLLNVVASGRGAILKRNGCETFNDDALPADGFHSLYGLDFEGLAAKLIGVGGTSIYSVDGAGGVTDMAVAVTADLRWDFIEAPVNGGQGPLFMSNGTDAPKAWDGVAAAPVAWTAATGNLPNPKYLLYKNNRVFAANMTAYTPSGGAALGDAKSALVFSAIGNPRDWPAENVVLFDPNDGEQITGIGTVGPYILVFKETKAWVVYDLDTGANRPLGAGVGCVSHRSIAETPDGVYFLSREGLMLTNGSTTRRVSDRVRPLLERIPPSIAQRCAAVYFDAHYYLSFPEGVSENTKTLDLDTRLDAWFIHSIGERDWAVWAPAGDPALFGSRAVAVDRCFVDDVLLDNGAAFAAYWAGPFLSFGKPYVNKRVRRIHFDGRGRIQVSLSRAYASAAVYAGEANFEPDLDTFGDTDGSGDAFGGEGIFGGEVEVGEAEIWTPGVSRAWSVTFGNQTSEAFEVDSYTFLISDRRDNNIRKGAAA